MSSTSNVSKKFGEGIEYLTCRLCHKQFTAINHFHLAAKHGWDSAHPRLEYKAMFGLPYSEARDAIDRRTKLMYRRLELLGKRWTRDRVLRVVKERRKKGLPLNEAAVTEDLPMATTAAITLFGGWDAVLERCGIDPDTVRLHLKWSRQRIVREIKELKRRDLPLHFMAVLRRRPRLVTSGSRHFGSWDDALRAAGVDPAAHRLTRRWTPAEIRRAIGYVAQDLGIRPSGALKASRICERFPGIHAAIRRHYRTTATALTAAGYRLDRVHHPRIWTPSAILKAIQARAKKGLPIYYGAVAKAEGGLFQAALRVHGTWEKAIAAAGCSASLPTWPKPWSHAELISILREVYQEHGCVTQTLLYRYKRPGRPAVPSAIPRVFGTLARARQAAGVAGKDRAFFQKAVLAEIKKLKRPLRRKHAVARYPTLVNRASAFFGGWEPALKKAGLTLPPPLSKVYTRERIVKDLKALGRKGKVLNTASSLYFAARKEFGSALEAAMYAGVPQVGPRMPKPWARKDLLSHLSAIIRQHGTFTKSILRMHYRRGYRALDYAVRLEFGSITAAKRALRLG